MSATETPAAPKHLVFVYGTLKVGQPQHNKLEQVEKGTAQFLGEAITLQKYPLVIATPANAPFLLFAEGKGHVSAVHTEIMLTENYISM